MKTCKKLFGFTVALTLLLCCFMAMSVHAYADCEHEIGLIDSGLTPTCTGSGYAAIYQCSNCYQHFADMAGASPIADVRAWMSPGGGGYLAGGHSIGPAGAQQAATCTEAGCRAYFQCSKCLAYFDGSGNPIGDLATWKIGNGYLPATGHHGGTATCCRQAICETCHQPYGEASGDHNFQLSYIGGKTVYACVNTRENGSLCGAVREAPDQSQTPSGTGTTSSTPTTEGGIEIEIPGVAATCETPGYRTLYKSTVGSVTRYFSDAAGRYPVSYDGVPTKWMYGAGKLKALGHKWSDWHVGDYPTRTRLGTMEGYCIRPGCNAIECYPIRYDCCPRTGDESHLGLWAAMCALSVVTLGSAAVIAVRRKRNDTI